MRVKSTLVHKHRQIAARDKHAIGKGSSTDASPATSKRKPIQVYLLPPKKRLLIPVQKRASRKSDNPKRILIDTGYEADVESDGDDQESGFWRDYLFVIAQLHVHFNTAKQG